MQDRSMYKPVFLASVLVAALFYLSLGMTGYVAFGAKTEDIILMNLEAQGGTSIIQILMCIGLLLTAPLQAMPAVEIWEASVFPHLRLQDCQERQRDLNSSQAALLGGGDFVEVENVEKNKTLENDEAGAASEGVRAGMRITTALVLVVVALFLPFFTVMIGLLGSLCCCQLGITFPAMLLLKLRKHEMSCLEYVFYKSIFIFGILCTVFSTGAILLSQVYHSV